MRIRLALPVLGVLFLAASPAAASSFKDISGDDELSAAVTALQAKGVVSGFPDGTFRPDAQVTRAEAVKLLVTSAGATAEDLKAYATSPFSDVKAGAWYLPSVEYARRKLSLIEGPPKSTAFRPLAAVTKAEFLKMMVLAHALDPSAYGDVRLPLSPDTDPAAWYYPFIRLAVSMGVTTSGKSGLISPGRSLTRADTALFLYRLQDYRDGRRTQALLTLVEDELLKVNGAVSGSDIRRAEYASARALLVARGAQTSMPKEAVTNGVLTLAQAYRSLVRGYRSYLDKNYDEAVRLAKESWNEAANASKTSGALKSAAIKLQTSAQALAADARKKK